MTTTTPRQRRRAAGGSRCSLARRPVYRTRTRPSLAWASSAPRRFASARACSAALGPPGSGPEARCGWPAGRAGGGVASARQAGRQGPVGRSVDAGGLERSAVLRAYVHACVRSIGLPVGSRRKDLSPEGRPRGRARVAGTEDRRGEGGARGRTVPVLQLGLPAPSACLPESKGRTPRPPPSLFAVFHPLAGTVRRPFAGTNERPAGRTDVDDRSAGQAGLRSIRDKQAGRRGHPSAGLDMFACLRLGSSQRAKGKGGAWEGTTSFSLSRPR